MNTAIMETDGTEGIGVRELLIYRVLFITGALWNLVGSLMGYFDTAATYQSFFGRALEDPLQLAIYRGSWGTALLYFFGYLIVAYNPVRHTGIVVLGTLGKLFFVWTLMSLLSAGLANPLVLVVVVGDGIFAGLFLIYLGRMITLRKEL